MAAAGVLTDVVGARAVWIGAGAMYLVAAVVAVFMTRWLPVATKEEDEAFEASAESAVAALSNGQADRAHAPLEEGANGTHTPPLERIAGLLEEIEARREAEAQRTS
jgi:uncharacterized ferritin-like protein (DUF455 family)